MAKERAAEYVISLQDEASSVYTRFANQVEYQSGRVLKATGQASNSMLRISNAVSTATSSMGVANTKVGPLISSLSNLAAMAATGGALGLALGGATTAVALFTDHLNKNAERAAAAKKRLKELAEMGSEVDKELRKNVEKESQLLDLKKEEDSLERIIKNYKKLPQAMAAVLKQTTPTVSDELSKKILDVLIPKESEISKRAEGSVTAYVVGVEKKLNVVRETIQKLKKELNITDFDYIDADLESKLKKQSSKLSFKPIITKGISLEDEMRYDDQVRLLDELNDYATDKKGESLRGQLQLLQEWEDRSIELAHGKEDLITQIHRTAEEERARISLENLQKQMQQYAQIALRTINVISGFQNNASQKELNGISQRERAMQDRYQIELDAINQQLSNTELSEQRKAELIAQRATLELQQNEAQNQIDEERRAAQRKAFAAQKTAATIESIIQTALAVVEALPNVPLSIAVGILGAAQTAVIAGQPTPEFHTGGTMGFGGVRTPLRSDEYPAILQVGETVLPRNTTNNRSSTTNHVSVTVNINAVGTPEEIVKKAVEDGLRKTGLFVEQYFVNPNYGMRQPKTYVIGGLHFV